MLIMTISMLLGLLALSVTAAATVGLLGMSLAGVYSPLKLTNAIGELAWGTSAEFLLVAIPLYVLMGELLVHSGVAGRMYGAVSKWVSWLPGGLMNANIGASAMFSATSGSSVATAATIATLALPEQRKSGYNAPLFLGSIAAGGTLGILIPPSINMIIYGAMTNTSVGRLYSAGIVPGLLLTALFMLVIVAVSWWRPAMAGAREPMAPLGVRLRALWGLVPPLGIFVVVMGTIYAGWATPTESAAVAVIAALLMAAAERKLSIAMLHECFVATVQVTAMITLIVVAAFYLNFVIGILGIPQALARFVAEIGAGPVETMLVLFVFYLILGCFLETLSMMIGTIPVVFPLVLALGIDPVWFGIFLVVMCELALITPPVGMNLYVVQGVRREGSVVQVIQGTMPFLAMMVLLTFLLIYWQDLALWLPRITFG